MGGWIMFVWTFIVWKRSVSGSRWLVLVFEVNGSLALMATDWVSEQTLTLHKNNSKNTEFY